MPLRQVAIGDLNNILVLFVAPDLQIQVLETKGHLRIPPLPCAVAQRFAIPAPQRELVVEFLVTDADVEPVAV